MKIVKLKFYEICDERKMVHNSPFSVPLLFYLCFIFFETLL